MHMCVIILYKCVFDFVCVCMCLRVFVFPGGVHLYTLVAHFTFTFYFLQKMKRVAVIGAGPAGLAALRHLLTRPHLYAPVAFEVMHDIGGQWLYADKKDVNQYGIRIHSSVYKDLVINIPKRHHAVLRLPVSRRLARVPRSSEADSVFEQLR